MFGVDGLEGGWWGVAKLKCMWNVGLCITSLVVGCMRLGTCGCWGSLCKNEAKDVITWCNNIFASISVLKWYAPISWNWSITGSLYFFSQFVFCIGVVPLATLNLQVIPVNEDGDIHDAWHHQMIYGVDQDSIHMCNPIIAETTDKIHRQLCSEPVLLVSLGWLSMNLIHL